MTTGKNINLNKLSVVIIIVSIVFILVILINDFNIRNNIFAAGKIEAAVSQNFTRNLYFGMRNNADVARLQRFLTDHGYYSGPVTGNFLSLTRGAVRRFQAAHSLPQTGYFGPLSRNEANKIYPASVGTTTSVGSVETAPTGQENCVQLDSARNNLNERRINLIVVGINYNSLSDFKRVANLYLDPSGSGTGLFSIEPYKSNRSFFNLLLVDKANSFSITQQTFDIAREQQTQTDLISLARTVSQTCSYEPKRVIVLLNRGISSFLISFANINELSLNLVPYPMPSAGYARDRLSLAIHETGGHVIGGLYDEYQWQNWLPDPAAMQNSNVPWLSQCYYVNKDNLGCRQEYGGYNCNEPSQSILNQCNVSAPWHDLVGNGCGREGVVDCDSNDINYPLEVRCTWSACSPNSLKSSGSGIMSHTISDTQPLQFNPYQQRLICRKIQELTGSVGGVCGNLCLAGCVPGKQCISGSCR